MKNYNESTHINVGCGNDYSIKEYVTKICKLFNYNGKIIWDTTAPNGMRRKLLDITKIKQMGWNSKIDIDTGLKNTINWFLERNK
jgi:GDP-L-fucose synthase